MPEIHPTAIVAPEAELARDVVVGPYVVIGPHARVGEATRFLSHVHVDGHTSIGRECSFFPFSSVGTRTQDLKYVGGAPRLEIGDRTTVRESVTLNAATADGDATVVGSDCLLMAYSHVAHDCQLGDGVILANCATLAGHVVVEDSAIIGGLSGVHQFVRIGRHVMIGGCAKVTHDVPPYMIADGNPLAIRGVNRVGLKRRGVRAEAQKQIKAAYQILHRDELPIAQAIVRLEQELASSPEMEHLIEFLRTSERGLTR